MHDDSLLTPQSVEMIVKSITSNTASPLSEIQAERFINALTRLQSNVPTGLAHPSGVSDNQNEFIKEG